MDLPHDNILTYRQASPTIHNMESDNQPQAASKSPFSGLSLIQKITVGYSAMAFFTMAALAFSSYNIYALNRTARGIAQNHLPVISAAMKLRTSLLTQERYAGKFTILKDRTFAQLFRQREKDSLANLALLEQPD